MRALGAATRSDKHRLLRMAAEPRPWRPSGMQVVHDTDVLCSQTYVIVRFSTRSTLRLLSSCGKVVIERSIIVWMSQGMSYE